MSNKTIVNGREMRISNHSALDNNTLLTTNKENLIINDNLTVKPEEVVIDKNTTINGNLVVSGSLTSETPAIDNNRLLLNTDSNVVADSSLLPVKDVRASPVGGWYVNNAGTGDKFNFYYYGKTNLPEVHTLAELKYLYCLVDIINGGNMYFSIYTQRQNDGNDAGAWYRSRINYIINGTGSTPQTGISLLTVNLKEEPVDIFDSVKRIPCSKEAFSSVGPQAEDEQILTISLQSDSSQPAGAVQYVIQNLGFKLEHVIQNFLHICDIGFNEGEVRNIIESYGYLTPAQISALVESYNYQTEAQVDALIDGRGYLTEPEIQALINGSAPNNNFFEGVLTANLSINGQDNQFYLDGAHGITATEGGGNWDGNVYTIPEDGNYKFSMGLTAENFNDEFKSYLDVLNGASEVQKKYILDWSNNAYGRFSSVSLPTLTTGDKLRVGVYNPDALGKNILGQGPLADRVYIDFESFNVAPISNSAGASIQGGWSGGAQPYFQNDSTDDETITNALSVVPGSNSWFTGNVQLYGNPGQGSPHTPKLQIEATAPDEATFNTNLQGKTYTASLWFYSPSANDNDGSVLKIYNGVYGGNDRTGFNLNIKKAAAALTVTSYRWDGVGFIEETLETNLTYDEWHRVDINIQYDAGGNPAGDVFTYQFSGTGTTGIVHNVPSWVNNWRQTNGFPLAYGTQISFGEASHVSGWYIDNIEYQIEGGAPEINTHFNIHKIN